MSLSVEAIAKVCHETNRAYCAVLGDNSQLPWEDAPEWQRNSAIMGVTFCMENPGSGASASHASWYAVKEKEGWKYGPVKDVDKKEHPCMVPYDELPEEQKMKDYLFVAIVRTLTGSHD